MLKNYDLLMTVKHVKNDSISSKVYLQKTRLKKKVEQIEEQKLGSKIDLQKVKVEQIEEKSTINIHIETIWDYHWIQKSIIRNVTSKSSKRARDQLSHINHSYKFLSTTCTTTTKDVDLIGMILQIFISYYILL